MVPEQTGCEDLPALIRELNHDPDILHLDYTPAVRRLTECGLEAVWAILPVLDSEDSWERLRAQRVLEGVMQRRYGWRPGRGFSGKKSRETEMLTLMRANGNYRAGAPRPQRRKSIRLWKDWLRRPNSKDEEE